MLAMALVLEGVDRKTAAETCGMDRQTLRDWVHRYNADGLAGLANRSRTARAAAALPAELSELASWVEAGPDPAVDGVVRWRRQDLRARIAARFGVEVHERTVGKYLAALGYRRLSVRPRHPKSDPEAQERFKKLSRGGSRGPAREGTRQGARGLVPGRGAGRPAGHPHPGLGEARDEECQELCVLSGRSGSLADRSQPWMGLKRSSNMMANWFTAVSHPLTVREVFSWPRIAR